MEWVIGGIILLFILGAFGKAEEQKKLKKQQEDEVQTRKQRAEEARHSILTSGDRELINRLRLMEAGYDDRKGAAASAQAPIKAGPSVLGTAAAVAGGMVVGNAVSGAIAGSQLEDALAQVEADMSDETTDFASASGDFDEPDFDFEL